MYRIYDIEVDINNISRVMDDFFPKQGDLGANKVMLSFPTEFEGYNVEVKFKLEDNSEEVITGVISDSEFSELIPDTVFTNSGMVKMQIKISTTGYSVTDNTDFLFVVSPVL